MTTDLGGHFGTGLSRDAYRRFVQAERIGRRALQQGQSATREKSRFEITLTPNAVQQPSPVVPAAATVQPPPPQKGSTMTTPSPSQDPVAEFHEAVCKLIDRGVDRRKATSQVAQCNPELHKRFLLATNSDNPSTQQDISDYFAEVSR